MVPQPVTGETAKVTVSPDTGPETFETVTVMVDVVVVWFTGMLVGLAVTDTEVVAPWLIVMAGASTCAPFAS